MTAVGRTLLTTDARALPYPPDLAPFLRGEDAADRGAAWAELLRRLFGAAGRARHDRRLAGALRERLARPGGLADPETARLVHALVPLRRCPHCERLFLSLSRAERQCSAGCTLGHGRGLRYAPEERRCPCGRALRAGQARYCSLRCSTRATARARHAKEAAA